MAETPPRQEPPDVAYTDARTPGKLGRLPDGCNRSSRAYTGQARSTSTDGCNRSSRAYTGQARATSTDTDGWQSFESRIHRASKVDFHRRGQSFESIARTSRITMRTPVRMRTKVATTCAAVRAPDRCATLDVLHCNIAEAHCTVTMHARSIPGTRMCTFSCRDSEPRVPGTMPVHRTRC